WFGRERAAWRERGWRGVVTPPRLAGVILTLLFLPSAGFWWATRPPALPDYAAVRAGWHPSEAWLYDRRGVLIDSSRVDY
ncbi:hypothetical protein, partial [Enterobacter hormaechei]|uniref:hypothetical protein n=1 Tax=Enterobacter hormaechei TaxID=158836 RepID=UPI0013D64060